MKNNTVLQGDCLELMKNLPDKSIDMILCDLPYGTTACKWDTIIPFEPLWEQYKRIIKDRGAIVLFGSQPFTSASIMSNVKMFKYCWVWKKSISTGFNHCKNMPLKNYEDVAVFSRGSIQHETLTNNRMIYYPQGLIAENKLNKRGSKGFSRTMERASQSNTYVTEFTNYPRMVLDFPNEGKTLHPTQKPVALCEYLIKTYTNEGETILDNCAGSGTTAIACLNTNRNYILMEKESQYIETINNRISEHEKNHRR